MGINLVGLFAAVYFGTRTIVTRIALNMRQLSNENEIISIGISANSNRRLPLQLTHLQRTLVFFLRTVE